MTRELSTRRRRFPGALAAVVEVLVAVLMVVCVAPQPSTAAPHELRTPFVRLRTLPVTVLDVPVAAGSARRASVTPFALDAGMHFTMAGVVCDAPSRGAVTLRLRTSTDGCAWGPWFEAQLETAGEGAAALAYTEAIWTGDARFVQIAAAAGSPSGPRALTGVRLIAIDSVASGGAAGRPTAAGGAQRVASAALGSAASASSAPTIVSRAEWGADESLRSGDPSHSPVKMAFIHHTDSGNAYSAADAPAIIRGIYAYHTRSLRWDDIGYNFLVDRYGTIYEGRYGGIARGVVGAHTFGFNTGSTGIAVMGTFTDEAPTAASTAALERLLAWKLDLFGLDPSGATIMTCGATDRYAKGTAIRLPVIAGHRQANYTECPGDAFSALLPAIRAEVAGRSEFDLTVALSSTAQLISPNQDGVLDSARLDVTLSASTAWRLAIRNTAGRVVASWTGQGTQVSVTWRGTSGDAKVRDGVYETEVAATKPDGTEATASTQITVDTTAPRLTIAAVDVPSFSPNGDGQTDVATLTYAPAEACSVRVGILDSSRTVVRWLHDWQPCETQPATAAWDGRTESAASGGGLAPAPDGLYRFCVERRDLAGNVARQGVKVTVDRTLGHAVAAPVSFSPNGDGVRDATSIGFELTRKATVTVRVMLGAEIVKTLKLGALPAGAHTASWDGRGSSGDYLSSCRPTFVVVTDSALGESSATGALTLDLYRPRIFAAKGKATSVGTRTRIGYKTVDPFSTKVDVSYVIRDAQGRRVASGHPGRQRVGAKLSIAWRPRAKGRYSVTLRAVDLAGNHEASVAVTPVRVRGRQ